MAVFSELPCHPGDAAAQGMVDGEGGDSGSASVRGSGTLRGKDISHRILSYWKKNPLPVVIHNALMP